MLIIFKGTTLAMDNKETNNNDNGNNGNNRRTPYRGNRNNKHRNSGNRRYPPRKQSYQLETLSDVIMYPFHLIYQITKREVSGGIALVLATIAALWMANSVYGHQYTELLHLHISFAFGGWHFEQSLQHFVNDALMAIFFLLVGLEIKHEFKEGELSSFNQALLPFVAAFFGMLVPALIYTSFNIADSTHMRGWAIPSATDIAFAIGVMALLGKRVPSSLKILLIAIAVIDDLGAILVIALFYNTGLDYNALLLAVGIFLVMLFLNKRGVTLLTPYVILGFFLWVVIFRSGIHATIAGVLTAMAVPLHSNPNSYSRRSPLKALEQNISPWVNFMILPIFAFMNAGVNFADMAGADSVLDHSVTLGILFGLFVGKQLGIFSAVFAMVRIGLSPMPQGTRWPQIYAMAALCGIGFTMSLFIGALAFPSGDYDTQVRAGVFLASVLSAVFGYVLLYFYSQRSPAGSDAQEGNQRRQNYSGGKRHYSQQRSRRNNNRQ